MNDRDCTLELIQALPPGASFKEIMDEIQLQAAIHDRLQKNPQGNGLPAETLLQEVPSWVTK